MRRNHSFALLMVHLLSVEAAASAPAATEVVPGSEVVQVLEYTVGWYNAVRAQPQSPAQPRDSVALSANQPVADKIVKLAFDFARSRAEWLTSQEPVDASSSPQALEEERKRLEAMRVMIQAQIDRQREQHGRSTAATSEQAARLYEMEGTLAMVRARQNLLDAMALLGVEISARGPARWP